MFEQSKRDCLNQASRKVQTCKFELSQYENKRTENARLQVELREESVQIEKTIKSLTKEVARFEKERQHIASGDGDFDIQMGILTDVAVSTRVRASNPNVAPVVAHVVAPLIVRSVSAPRKRDLTINPRYPCSEFYRNFGSNTRLYIKVHRASFGGMVDVENRVIVADEAIGGKTIFRSFNEWTVAHVAELNKTRDTKTSKSAYNVIWYQEKKTGEWVSLMTTAVIGNIIN
jgi:hypothetical protein